MKKVGKKIDYRHFICVAITLAFVLVAIFVFSSALGRLIEGVRDFGLSFAYYFCNIFGIETSITPTVNNLPIMPFFDLPNMPSSPVPSLPETFEGFKVKWHEYWQLTVTSRNIVGYLDFLGRLLLVVANAILYIIPFVFIIYMAIKEVLDKENNDYNIDSKPLIIARRISDKTYKPAKNWIVDFVAFVKDNKAYYILWAVIWAYNLNLFTIVIEFFAFYFYFAVSWDMVHIYRQIYKLFIDLWTPFNFIPWYVWCVIALAVFDKIRKKIGFAVLNHNEMKNRGFINERPIVFMGCGTMGKKKTTFITDVALSQEVMFRDKAFEKILENDLKFPNFPWINLENALKKAMDNHTVYNLATCKRFAISKRLKWERKPHRRNIFMYDFERYGLYYDDKLKVTSIWETKKRFRRKAYLNKWNYFVTITYDDKKHDEESFRKKLRRCLSNLHTRRGWKYMGVFEHAPETHRLHFHALMYIPDGEMIGNVAELRDYSTAQGQMQVTHSNTFFADSFGRNDFEKLNEQELRHGGTINYLLKYISKTGERIVYSRGIPTAICMKVKDKDIATSMEDYVTKYLLFDDVIKYERDIARYKTKQMTFIDIFCNPPKVA